MKVYAVFSGQYDEWDIVGVYSDYDLAVEANRLHGNQNDLVEMELNAMPDHPPGHLPYGVLMDQDGNVSQVYPASLSEMAYAETTQFRPEEDSGGEYKVLTKQRFWLFRAWAKDQQHAVKIANERRATLIANGFAF